MSLRLVPSTAHPTSTTNLTTRTPSTATTPSAPSAPGLHDTLRSNLSLHPPSTLGTTSPHTTPPTLQSTHPLEARLARWRSTQQDLKMAGLRRTFGIAEPVRRGMELKIAREGEWRPGCLGGSAGVSGDVLEGRDERIEWEDVYCGDETRQGADFHSEMEGRLKMNW
ncbi:hypothetical protein MMC14_005338 [Varicellaria rhodocarpa]|nr:hypothetical protein [Varicellaria rhodocarpa]